MSGRDVVRLHLRSTVEGVDHVAIENWCLRTDGLGWAGVGWGLWDGGQRRDLLGGVRARQRLGQRQRAAVARPARRLSGLEPATRQLLLAGRARRRLAVPRRTGCS